jgi:hypothetical protein
MLSHTEQGRQVVILTDLVVDVGVSVHQILRTSEAMGKRWTVANSAQSLAVARLSRPAEHALISCPPSASCGVR